MDKDTSGKQAVPARKATSFEWRINSPRGKFTGEEKAELVAKMEEIALRVSQGGANVEFSYDTGSVIAKISAKLNQEMKHRAAAKARVTATKGITGLVARAIMFWNGLGKDAQSKLIAGLEADYLHDEKAIATSQMARAFSMIISHANIPRDNSKIVGAGIRSS